MGLVLNPYAYRIGHVNSWSDSWYLISAEYSEFLHSSTLLKSFVYYVLYKFYPTRFSYWLISHIEILFFNNNMYIWLYLYEASGKYKITKNIRFFKYGLFKGMWLKSYWLKKQLFDKNPVALSIFSFLRLFGSHIEKYESIENYVFEGHIRKKLVSLRKRYGRQWLGVEEIMIMRTALSFFLKSASRAALQYLSGVIQSFLILPFRKGNLDISRLRGPRVFMFFFSIFMLLLKQWPYYKTLAPHFISKIIFVFLRQIVFFKYFYPFINYLSRFLEYLCSFFGYSSVVRASIITNFSLSAFFIARYIMTAIKNGFNYWDILFPIRKTLGRFMQIKLFDNFIKKQIPVKTTYLKGALAARIKRINLLTSFIIFLKSKLVYDDIYKSSYVYNGYYKIFSFSSFVRKRSNGFFIFLSHKNYIIKRFFCNIFKKKLFEFLANRLTLERVNEIRRLSRKPITLLQRQKYNKRRRMKRLEKRSTIDLSEQRATLFELFEEFNNRLSYIRSFNHKFINAKRSLMVVRHSSKKFFRSYNISNKKIFKNNIKSIRFIFFLKFYVIFFIIKFYKSVRLIINKKFKSKKIKYIYIIKKKKGSKKKQLFKVDKNFFVRMHFFFIYRLKTFLLKLVYNKISLEFFSLLFFYRYLLKKWFIFSKYTNRDLVFRNRVNIGNFNKKLVRFYHSSSFSLDRIIDILLSLSKNDHKIDKRHRRFTYGSILKKMGVDQYKNRSISYKNMPSDILTRIFKDSKKEDKLNILNNILRNIDIVFILVKRINLVVSKKKLMDKSFFILKFYEVFYYLLILKLFWVNHYKIDNLFIIVKQFFFSKMSKLNYQFYKFLVRALNIIKYFTIKYIRLYITSFFVVKRNRFVMFNFIIKIINFFYDKGYKMNVFHNYFLTLLRSILCNFKNISDLNNLYIIRLFVILDNYWYLGYKIYKRRRKQKFFSTFFDNFNYIFSLVVLVFKLLFTSIKYDSSYFYVVYRYLLHFVPFKFRVDWHGYSDEFFFFLLNPYPYSKHEFKMVKKFYLYSALESFNHYEMLITNFNFIGKESFSAFINGYYFFRTFPVNISNYFNYFNVLLDSFGQTLTLHTKLVSNKLLPYGDKIIRNKARDHVKSFLYGFKFHFVGRFTRKQQSASMWFRQGFLPSSSMKAEVDYGIFTIPLRFSACTVKVWLYKGFYAPKRLFTYGKWL